jgi:hypothetical protein
MERELHKVGSSGIKGTHCWLIPTELELEGYCEALNWGNNNIESASRAPMLPFFLGGYLAREEGILQTPQKSKVGFMFIVG